MLEVEHLYQIHYALFFRNFRMTDYHTTSFAELDVIVQYSNIVNTRKFFISLKYQFNKVLERKKGMNNIYVPNQFRILKLGEVFNILR